MTEFAISFGAYVLGAACVVLGARQMYPPAGWITFGGFLLLLALLPKVRRP